jgi:pantetheine-phosphate adenylyltransferase
MEVILSACGLFERVYVAVLNNSAKRPLFSPEERLRMIDNGINESGLKNVSSLCFDGLLVELARKLEATHIIRGLRAVTDFENEFQIHAVNRHLAPELRTVYFMASPAYSFLSSSQIKEIAGYGGNIEGLVPECNINIITERLKER